jgi:hypothetical protein
MPDQASPQQDQPDELPMEVQIAQAVAEIVERHASAKQKNAAARKLETDALLAPAEAEHEASLAVANFHQSAENSTEDRKIKAKQASRKPVAA